MPTLTRWFLRSALVYLLLSLLIGVALAAPHHPALDALAPVYVHFFMVGWVDADDLRRRILDVPAFRARHAAPE
jgi:hypothetical protein